MCKWKVFAEFTTPDGDGEITEGFVKFCDTKDEMENYVFACKSHGAVDGIVYHYDSISFKWEYYMDI